MEFQIGDRVRFTSDDGQGWAGSVHGMIYTVTDVDEDNVWGDSIVFVDAPATSYGERAGCYPSRFELVERPGHILDPLRNAISALREQGFVIDVTVTEPPSEPQVWNL